jgi:hypothetical protein
MQGYVWGWDWKAALLPCAAYMRIGRARVAPMEIMWTDASAQSGAANRTAWGAGVGAVGRLGCPPVAESRESSCGSNIIKCIQGYSNGLNVGM